MRICEVCGATDEETKVHVSKKFNQTLCRKHYLQMVHHGKILQRTIYDPNYIREDGIFAYIELYDVAGNFQNETKIDIKFVEDCKNIKWYLRPSGYAFGSIRGITKKVKLHTYIYKCVFNEIVEFPYELDHIDGDPLNNTIGNLAKVSHKENMQNIHKKYKVVGVNYNKWNGHYKWIPKIMVDGKSIWLGVYDTKEEAIKVRKEAEIKYFRKC